MVDKKTLDPKLASSEKHPSEYIEPAMGSIQNKAISETNSSINFASSKSEDSLSALLQARKALYEHIKALPVESNFFLQQDKTYKRELVDIMRRIDKEEIKSESELNEQMEQMASDQKSDSFNALFCQIKEILNSADTKLENNLSPPSM